MGVIQHRSIYRPSTLKSTSQSLGLNASINLLTIWCRILFHSSTKASFKESRSVILRPWYAFCTRNPQIPKSTGFKSGLLGGRWCGSCNHFFQQYITIILRVYLCIRFNNLCISLTFLNGSIFESVSFCVLRFLRQRRSRPWSTSPISSIFFNRFFTPFMFYSYSAWSLSILVASYLYPKIFNNYYLFPWEYNIASY